MLARAAPEKPERLTAPAGPSHEEAL